MNKTTGILIALALSIALLLAAQLTGLLALNGDANANRYKVKGMLELICDVEISRPDDNLMPPFETSKLKLPVIINFDDSTGAYPGEYTISMNRKGTLHVNDALLEIHRPAMFKRHGVTIFGERVELNRRTGQFQQWLELGQGKRLQLISGTCKRTDNAPF